MLKSAVLSRFSVALLLLQGCVHLTAVIVTATIGKLLETQLGRTPLDDLNFNNAAAPLFHQIRRGLIDINRTGVNQCAAVVIHYINIGLTLDFETSTQRIDRPIRSGAAHLIRILEGGTDGITGTVCQVVTFRVGIRSCSYNAIALRRVVERHAMLISSQLGKLGIRLG